MGWPWTQFFLGGHSKSPPSPSKSPSKFASKIVQLYVSISILYDAL